MDITTHRARVTGPLPYQAGTGRERHVPVGPCLVMIERAERPSIDIIWGERGQSSVALTVEEMVFAQDRGQLVMLD
jgi:hypothetical protein